MQRKQVLILNREDLEKGLIEFHVNVLADKTYVREMLLGLGGTKGTAIHVDVKSMSTEKLIDEYAELCVGEDLLQSLAEQGEEPIDYVVFQKENGDMLFLCQKEQNKPKEWGPKAGVGVESLLANVF